MMLPDISSGNHTLTVYAGDIAGGVAGKATVSFNVAANVEPSVSFIYPPTAYGNALGKAMQMAAQTYLPYLFWLMIGFALAATLSAVIVVIVLTRKKPNQTAPPY
jgi:hypothetical protein